MRSRSSSRVRLRPGCSRWPSPLTTPERSTVFSSRRSHCSHSRRSRRSQPLPATARELGATLAAGRRVLDLTDREPPVRDPAEPATLPRHPRRRARGRHGPLRRRATPCSRLHAAPRAGTQGRAGRSERRGQDDRHEPAPPIPRPRVGPGYDRGPGLRDYRQEDVRRMFALAGQEAHLSSTRRSARTCSWRSRARPSPTCGRRSNARASATGSRRFRTASTRSWGRRGRGSPAVSASASSSPVPFSRTRRCSSSTSRPPTSTRPRRSV